MTDQASRLKDCDLILSSVTQSVNRLFRVDIANYKDVAGYHALIDVALLRKLSTVLVKDYEDQPYTTGDEISELFGALDKFVKAERAQLTQDPPAVRKLLDSFYPRLLDTRDTQMTPNLRAKWVKTAIYERLSDARLSHLIEKGDLDLSVTPTPAMSEVWRYAMENVRTEMNHYIRDATQLRAHAAGLDVKFLKRPRVLLDILGTLQTNQDAGATRLVDDHEPDELARSNRGKKRHRDHDNREEPEQLQAPSTVPGRQEWNANSSQVGRPAPLIPSATTSQDRGAQNSRGKQQPAAKGGRQPDRRKKPS